MDMHKRRLLPSKIPIIDKFNLLINKNSGIFGESNDYLTECWQWCGEILNNGYGRMTYMHSRFMAHRWSYEYFNGPIQDGMQIDHLCRVRRCVNPKHLEQVTCSENLARGNTVNAINRKKTHCIRNHEFTEINTGIDFRGDRYCRECARQKALKFRAKKKLENPSC